MTTEVSYAEAVAWRAHCTPGEALSVLAEHAVPTTAAVAKPHRLRVTRLLFSGEKSGVDEGPFLFEQEFGDGLWALVSERNEAGKTSVFEVMMWALRGSPRDELQADVRAWIQRVELDGLIDGDAFSVRFDVAEGGPVGVLHYGERQWSFTTAEGFSDVMSSFMLEGLGLATFTNWVKDKGSQTHGWPSYTGGLYLSRESLGVVLGHHVQGGLPGRLLLMFVGVPWAQTLAAAQTARKGLQEGQQKSSATENAMSHRVAQELADLSGQLDKARRRLAAMPDTDNVLAEVDAAAARWMGLASECAQLEDHRIAAEREVTVVTSALTTERKRLIDLTDAKAAYRLFHGMNPTQCPRCSTAIDDTRRESEAVGGRCAVCTTDITEVEETIDPTVDPDEADHEQDSVEEARERVRELEAQATAARERVRALQGQLEASEDARDAAQVRLADLRARSAGMEQWRSAELQVAQLEARVDQLDSLVRAPTLPSTPGPGAGPAGVLRAAEDEASQRIEDTFQAVLDALNNEILDLGRRFGIDSLQSITINRATHMKVGKGGSVTSYTNCTPGEKLRLRIALVTALLRVAERQGVGRHPGLLLIDSIGAEETEAGDLAEFMRHLVAVTDALGIETIVASARPEILEHVDDDHARVARGTDYLW